jgi:hypothetical protein
VALHRADISNASMSAVSFIIAATVAGALSSRMEMNLSVPRIRKCRPDVPIPAIKSQIKRKSDSFPDYCPDYRPDNCPSYRPSVIASRSQLKGRSGRGLLNGIL